MQEDVASSFVAKAVSFFSCFFKLKFVHRTFFYILYNLLFIGLSNLCFMKMQLREMLININLCMVNA
jgi:hypothetical protein